MNVNCYFIVVSFHCICAKKS